MYKLFVTTLVLDTSGTYSKVGAVHTTTIEFGSKLDANIAYKHLKARDSLIGLKREIVKLYED